LPFHHIPNLITLARILLVPPILWLVLQERFGAALLLFLVAGVSDGIDGFLAKRFGWTSWWGGILDPLADKLLLMGTVLALGWEGILPPWLVALIVLRDVVIVSGALAYHYFFEPVEATPLLISKLNTLMQIMLVLTVIFDRSIMALPDALLTTLFAATALTTLWSGAAYVVEWSRRAWHKGKRVNVS
jgi:cardiolipin synthase